MKKVKHSDECRAIQPGLTQGTDTAGCHANCPALVPAFDPNAWAARWKANGDEGERNDQMDSGWSVAIADRCARTAHLLLFELFKQLQGVEIKPDDFFDRPALAAVLAAVHEGSK